MECDGGALAALACEHEFAAQLDCSFAHARESQGSQSGIPIRLDQAAAVVADREYEVPVPFGEQDIDPGGTGMADNVRERFLENPEAGRRKSGLPRFFC